MPQAQRVPLLRHGIHQGYEPGKTEIIINRSGKRSLTKHLRSGAASSYKDSKFSASLFLVRAGLPFPPSDMQNQSRDALESARLPGLPSRQADGAVAASQGRPGEAARVVLCLGAIMAIGAFLRFHNLDTPSMWADEMQAAFGASFPIDYLMRWIMAIEVHPPTYHLLLKFFLLFGDSAFVLRLPSALAGVGTIYLVYWLAAENAGVKAGLLAAALLAGDTLHIWISRQVRPYGVLVFLFCLSLIHFCRFLQSGSARDFRRFLLANVPLVLFHLLSVLILAAQGVILACSTLAGRTRPRQLLWFVAASLASFAPVSPVFLKTLLSRPDVTAPSPMAKVLQDSLTNFLGLFDFFRTGWSLWLYLAPLGAGLALLARRNRTYLGMAAAFVLVPMAVIIAKRYAAYYFSTHLSFMLPVLLVPAGLGLALLARSRGIAGLLAVCLAAGLGYGVLTRSEAKLYREDSLVVTWWNFGNFKTMGRELAKRFTEKDLVVFSDGFLSAAVDWYYRGFSGRDPIERQELGPADMDARLFLMDISDDLGPLAGVAQRAARDGRLLEKTRADKLWIQELDYPRTPVTRMASLPFVANFTAEPDDVYVRAYSLKDLTIHASGRRALRATRYDAPGTVEYVLSNDSGSAVGFLALGLQFENTGEGNQIAVEYSFDSQLPVRTVVTKGPDARRFSYAEIVTPATFSRLSLRIELTCRRNTPSTVAGSLETLKLQNVFVAACASRNDGPCSAEVAGWYDRMLRQSYLGEGFASKAMEQAVSVEDQSMAARSSEKPGWDILSPASNDHPVRIKVRPASGGDSVFFPRVGGNAKVRVYRTGPDGAPREVFLLPGGDGGWSPIGARYHLTVADGEELLVELSGRGAQLWVRQDKIFFRP